MSLRLGIDTGGTYTDAVLVDDDKCIVAAEKALTTRFDLTQGIGDVIDMLPAPMLTQITMVSLSTTLTTNSVVEGLGAPVCVLLPGYNPAQVKQSGLLDILPQQLVVILEGGFDAVGKEQNELDEDSARSAIIKLQDQVSAFAISSMFGTRNSSHENKLKALVTEITSMPVICGHELASSLGAPRRALTAALNARMVPPVRELIASVTAILDRHKISAPLMIVKGDGSLASMANAIEKPIGTVLSGPAASVIGACELSGLKNAIVADMGGTTTDIAIISNGQPELAKDGATVGDWQPMIEAVRVNSIGLGGDSEVRFGGHKGLVIGPRRVVPTSLLAHLYPEVIPKLEAQLSGMVSASSNRFVMRLENNHALLKQLNEVEREAWDSLRDAPVELDAILLENRNYARAMARLKRLGLAIYSGFTPSDAVHVLGINSHWSKPAAELSAKLWMRQIRYLYGYGNWGADDTEQACEEVYELVKSTISRSLIEVGLNESETLHSARTRGVTEILTQMVLKSGRKDRARPLFKVEFAGDYPIVAVGAPASSYYRDVAESMHICLHLPDHADVANAFGAVMGSVIQRAQVTVTQPQHGTFCLFNNDQPQHFETLAAAKQCAEAIVVEEAERKALDAGAKDPKVTLSYEDIHVNDEIDGELFLESMITATAIGPACDWQRQHNMKLDDLAVKLEAFGLHLRGVLTLPTEELKSLQIDTDSDVSIALVGNIGSSYWPVFSQSPEYQDGQPDPLDRWSRRIAEQVADTIGANAIYPFEGPPYYPFLQWAKRAEALSQSPIGLMIHPNYGLWHSYRFGLLLPRSLVTDATAISVESPCQTCETQPCLHTCPVDAFSPKGYNVESCAAYLKQTPDARCHQQGCLARNACPVGEAYRYEPAQHTFHLRAFLGARLSLTPTLSQEERG